MALNPDHIRQLLDDVASTDDDLSAQKADELLNYVTREKAVLPTASFEATERRFTRQEKAASASDSGPLQTIAPLKA